MIALNISKFPKVIVANLEFDKIEVITLKDVKTVPLPYIALSKDRGETWVNEMTIADVASRLSTQLFSKAYKSQNETAKIRCQTCCCRVEHEHKTRTSTSLAVEIELMKRHTFEENGYRLPKTCKDCFWTFDPERSLIFSLKALDEKLLENYKLLIPTLEFVAEEKLLHVLVRNAVIAIQAFLLSNFVRDEDQQTDDQQICEDEEEEHDSYSTRGRLEVGVAAFDNVEDDSAWSFLYKNVVTDEDRDFVSKCYWLWGKRNRPTVRLSQIVLYKGTVFHCCENGSDMLWSDGKQSFLVTRGSKVVGSWSYGDASGWIGKWLLATRPNHLGSHCSCQFEQKNAAVARGKEKLSSIKAQLLADLDSIPLLDEWVKTCYKTRGDFVMQVMERKKRERSGFFDSFSCY